MALYLKTGIFDLSCLFQVLSEDINSQKSKARDMIASGKRLLREGSVDDEGAFNDKMDTLKQQSDAVSKLSSDRMVQLEQAMPLSKTFLEAHQDLLAWFSEVEPAVAELEVMSINQDQVKKQQDKVKVSRTKKPRFFLQMKRKAIQQHFQTIFSNGTTVGMFVFASQLVYSSHSTMKGENRQQK